MLMPTTFTTNQRNAEAGDCPYIYTEDDDMDHSHPDEADNNTNK